MKKKTLTAIITAALVLTTALTSLIIIGRKSNVNTNKKINGLNEELSEIMYLGSLAPSSHNIQCWLIELYPDVLNARGGSKIVDYIFHYGFEGSPVSDLDTLSDIFFIDLVYQVLNVKPLIIHRIQLCHIREPTLKDIVA